MNNIKKIKLEINGMHCVSCSLNIDFDLEDLAGIHSAKTSYAKQICEVEFDAEKLTPKQIIERIKSTGYTAKVIK